MPSISVVRDGVEIAEPGAADPSDAEEGDKGSKRGKKGKHEPWLESMQRNLHKFMPLTSEGKYLLVRPLFLFLPVRVCLVTYDIDGLKNGLWLEH